MKTSYRISVIAAALALGLAACGTDDETPESEPATTAAPVATTAPEASPTAGGTTGAPNPPGAPSTAWRTAILTAEQHAGGTPYELDDEDDDGSWEIDVAVDGRSIEVTVASDGTTVRETEEDDLDDDDRRALDAATVSMADAIATALDEVPGELDDVELESEGGTFVWEVTIDEDDGDDDVDVYVGVDG